MSYWPNTGPDDRSIFIPKDSHTFGTRLGRKLVVLVLIVNALLSVIASGVQLYVGYNRDRTEVNAAITGIEEGFAVGFADALWEYNFPLVEALLEGVYTKRDVQYVVLRSETGREWSLGTPSDETAYASTLNFEFMPANGKPAQVGTLQVGLTYVHIQAKVWSQLWVLLASNFAKTAFASLIMLVLFERLISRHLTQIARHVQKTTWQTTGDAIALDRYLVGPPDDLDHIVAAINTAKARAQTDFAALQNEVQQRRAAETKLRLKSEALEHTNREQAEFTYAISHDLKSPANTLSMLLDDLNRDEVRNFSADGREILKDARNTVARMTLLVEDVLGYARTVSDGITFAPVDLNAVVAELVTDIKADIAAADAQVTVDSLPTFEGHAVQLRMLMQNLLTNALKFRVPDLPVRIRVEGEVVGEDVVLRVSDNGIGIPIQFRERIFGLFQRLHSHGAYPGSGLGLSLCHRIVMNHGGHIAVLDRKGGGTTFEVRLPREQNDI